MKKRMTDICDCGTYMAMHDKFTHKKTQAKRQTDARHTAGPWEVNARGVDEWGNNLVAINGAQGMDAVDRSRLIAAAPEMLEFLRWLQRNVDTGPRCYEKLDAIVAKAEGRHE